MSVTFDPGQRPSGWDTAGDHERRIRALEALQPCCDDSGGDTFQNFVLTHPCVASYWPMDDTGPGAIDLGPAGANLIENPTGNAGGFPAGTQGTFAFEYEQPGPFAGSESIKFEGDFIGASARGTALYYQYPGANATEGSHTLLGWVRLTDVNGTCVTFWGGGTPQTLMSAFSDDFQWGAVTTATTAIATATNAAVVDTWFFLAGTYDEPTKTFELFVNGASAASATLSVGDNDAVAGYIRFGVSGNSAAVTPAGFLNGHLSNWALFDCVLSDDDILTLYGLDQIGNAAAGMVLTADGSGGTYWAYPTIEVLEDGS